jgi:hypothetical protein
VLPGFGIFKKITSSDIDPGTFRFVAYCLNHYAAAYRVAFMFVFLHVIKGIRNRTCLVNLLALSQCWGIPGMGYCGWSLNGRFKFKHPSRVVWTTVYLKDTAVASGLIERKQSTISVNPKCKPC